MARPPRGQSSRYAYHVLNRGNGGAPVFHKDEDYRAFLDLLADAKTKFSVNVFGFCLMPNHFHIVLQPRADEGLSLFLQWWQTSYSRHYHQHYRSHGHLWEGRFKSFPIQRDGHLLTVLRYILRNPVRAGLVPRTDQWPWSSLQHRTLLDPWPVETPPDLAHWAEAPLSDQELAGLRSCVNRQAPFGTADWQEVTAKTLGLASTLRPHGRPRKQSPGSSD
jgi:putative transposase